MVLSVLPDCECVLQLLGQDCTSFSGSAAAAEGLASLQALNLWCVASGGWQPRVPILGHSKQSECAPGLTPGHSMRQWSPRQTAKTV